MRTATLMRMATLAALAATALAQAACGNTDTATATKPDSSSDSTQVADAKGDTQTGDTIGGSDGQVTDTAGGDTIEPLDTQPGTDDVAGDDADSTTTPDTSPKDTGGDTTSTPATFKSLLIKILGPTGRDWGQSGGAAIQLTGAAFGAPDSISWVDGSGATGKITPGEYWKSSILTLKPGDNHYTVTATKGTATVSDTVHIVYNPVFQFDGPPEITPNVLFVNESNNVVVHFSAPGAVAATGAKPIIDPATITLIETDELGQAIAAGVSAQLKDSGSSGDCDDVQKDAVFSECVAAQSPAAKRRYFRVKAQVDVGVQQYTAYSPLAAVDVVQRFDKGTCNNIVNLQKKSKDQYIAAVTGGQTAKGAQVELLNQLKADALVAEAGPAEDGGYGVWIRYKSGQLGALSLAPAGVRGASGPIDAGALAGNYSVGARRALSLAPNQAEFSKTGGDEADTAGTNLKNKQCPPFAVDQATGSNAYLSFYRTMSSYGLVAISGHGDALFGGMDLQAYKDLGWEHHGAQEVIWSGEPVNCSALSSSTASCSQAGTGCPAGETCIKTSVSGGICVDHTQADIMRGRAIIGDTTYGLTPELLRFHLRDNFAQSIVYLGACRSMFNGTLALELRSMGAATVIGFSDYVSSQYAAEKGGKFFDNLINAGANAASSLPTADADPAYGGKLRMLGIDESNVNNSALINPSWDSGNLTGWKPVGDGRVISRLGVTIPVAGKYMGIISTGLGFTTQNGSLAQPFCVDDAKTELCFYWKFYSEEFKEYCGSSFMDTFMATLTSELGKNTMVNVYIDSLCDPDCGGKAPCEWGSPSCQCGKDYKGLSQSDVNFDQGGVWMTPWQKTCQDVSPLAGSKKKVELQFFATDKGDSIFDTAILIDEVTVK